MPPQTPYYNKFAPTPEKLSLGRGRKRMNIVSICLCMFVPWLVFCFTYAMMSFYIHYNNPWFCYGFVGMGFVFCLASFALAVNELRAGSRRREYGMEVESERGDATWFVFFAFTCLLAWMLAVVAGQSNFSRHMQPFYDVINLNTYTSVDPSRMLGQQVMDGGHISFIPGTRLDLSRAIGFKNDKTYCVAPITLGTAPLTTYDFWAVGTDCCTGEGGVDFQCGEFNNQAARSGLRLMRDEQRSFFRLAVQQAESTYSIRATHPIFLYWMQDNLAATADYQDDGFKYYLLGMFAHFALQLVLVVVAAIAFASGGFK